MNILRTLFSYTQTSVARRIVTWTLFPYIVYHVADKSRELIHVTFDLVQEQGLWQSMPYILGCAVVVAITRQAKIVARNLRMTYKLRG